MSLGRILILDDEESVRGILSTFFEREGFEVRGAADGTEALKTIREERFDVVLMDLKMPGLNGIQALDRIKQICPQIVVLMFTGYPSPDTTLEALELGSDGYINKPVNLVQLKSLVVRGLLLRKWEQKKQKVPK